VVGTLVWLALRDPSAREELAAAAPWILMLFAVEMFPFPVWRDIRISLGYPVVMFLAVLYQPATVGLVTLIGGGDPRELTGQSDLLRSAFNRSQVAAAAAVASAVFHALAPAPHLGGAVIGAAVAAGGAQVLVNMVLVGVAARLDYRVPLWKVLRSMPIGNSLVLQGAYVGFGVLGAVLALLYLEVGVWAAVGLVPPLLALAHLLRVTRALERAESDLQREASLKKVSEQLAEERHQERQHLAALLHDEISSLLTSSGLYLHRARGELEGSHPAGQHVRAAEEAGREADRHVRALIGELLQSPTGPAGTSGALRRLLDHLHDTEGVVVRHDLASIDAPQTINELLFGIAREAARNAVRHGKARSLEVTLHDDEGVAVLSVRDDGSGFDPAVLGTEEGRYGLRLLRDRAEACGGRLDVVSAPGKGTEVTAHIPIEPADRDR
jgi:signal transduction histidine kinase